MTVSEKKWELIQATYPVGLRPIVGRNRQLRTLLALHRLVVAPGAFDCITARLVETEGFPAVYITGSGVSMSALGAPDVGLMSFAEVLDRVKRICDVVSIPVIADADTGYGGPLNIVRTVREFERAGVSAVQIEDQAWPKKCGHEIGRKLIRTAEMTARLKAALDARLDEDLVIIARTDARTSEGLEEALARGAAYQEAGADVVFIESPESEEEMRLIARRFRVPTLANMVEGGRTPIFSTEKLQEFGFQIAIYPNSLTRVLGKVGRQLLQHLKREGSTAGMADLMLSHNELWALFERDKWTNVEQDLGDA
jgi:2,3-dimethylmalate lyase